MRSGKPFSGAEALLTSLAILPIGLDGVGSYLGFWKSSQLLRVLTGSLVGAVIPGFLLLAGNFDPNGEQQPLIYEKTRELLLLMSGAALFGLCLWAGLPLAGLGAVFSVLGEILLWGGLVWLILGNFLPNRNVPYWRISLAAAGIGLFVIGGVIP